MVRPYLIGAALVQGRAEMLRLALPDISPRPCVFVRLLRPNKKGPVRQGVITGPTQRLCQATGFERSRLVAGLPDGTYSSAAGGVTGGRVRADTSPPTLAIESYRNCIT